MAVLGNDAGRDDNQLRQDVENYVKQNLKREEILDFVSSKYLNDAWSLRTLCRRLNYFNISYQDYDNNLNDLHRVVEEEMKGPGKLLGYRALHKKIREIHGLKVPRDLVYAITAEVDPAALQERAGVGRRKRARKNGFASQVIYHST